MLYTSFQQTCGTVKKRHDLPVRNHARRADRSWRLLHDLAVLLEKRSLLLHGLLHRLLGHRLLHGLLHRLGKKKKRAVPTGLRTLNHV